MSKPKRTTYIPQNARDVRLALRKKYDAPAWAIFEEVGNATGFGTSRHADAVAMSIWPSRGLEIVGFEIKCSRNDWMRELAQPEKADEILSYCDRWCVVASSDDIVRDGELPPTWGLLIATARGLVTKVVPPQLKPEPLDRSFLAAILRRAHESAASLMESEFNRGREQGIAEAPAREEMEDDRAERRLKELEGRVASFQTASGVKIDDWNAQNIGKAVAAVLSHHQDSAGLLRDMKRRADGLVRTIEEEIAIAEQITAMRNGPAKEVA